MNNRKENNHASDEKEKTKGETDKRANKDKSKLADLNGEAKKAKR